MLQKQKKDRTPPRLCVAIDAEEEFDWGSFSKDNRQTSNILQQEPAQLLMDEYGLCPMYLVDTPVVEDPTSRAILRDYVQQGRCSIGAQLHPWVSPPYTEEVSPHTSILANLPLELQRAKIEGLLKAIEDAFGEKVTTFRAGRFGISSQTMDLLAELGFKIDSSVMPYTDYTCYDGGDFSGIGPDMFWWRTAKPGGLLEIPTTLGFSGVLASQGSGIYPLANSLLGQRLRLPGILARLRLLDRVRLTPEGVRLHEACRLVKSLYARGQRTFVLTYHSSSLLPGATPYVRDQEALRAFMDFLRDFLRFFFVEMRGEATTFDQIYAEAAIDPHIPCSDEVRH